MRQENLVGAGPIHITVALIIDSLMKWIIIAMNIPFGKKLLVPIYCYEYTNLFSDFRLTE
jgi:hypothetical protein